MSYQFPQGGIQDGELPHQAALRELEEETGITSVRIVAELPRWLTYDFPSSLLGKMSGSWRRWRGQKQKWFLLHFHGEGSEIDLGRCGDLAEFLDYEWVGLSEAPDLVVAFKRDIYDVVVAEFVPVLRELEWRSRQTAEAALRLREGDVGTSPFGRARTGVLMDPQRWTVPASPNAVNVPVRIIGAGTGNSEIVAGDYDDEEGPAGGGDWGDGGPQRGAGPGPGGPAAPRSADRRGRGAQGRGQPGGAGGRGAAGRRGGAPGGPAPPGEVKRVDSEGNPLYGVGVIFGAGGEGRDSPQPGAGGPAPAEAPAPGPPPGAADGERKRMVAVVCGRVIGEYDRVTDKFRALGSARWMSGAQFERMGKVRGRGGERGWMDSILVAGSRQPLREWIGAGE